MLLRLALFIILGVIVARAFWRLVDGIIAGARGGGQRRGAGRGNTPGVQMVRDPVCGTFVLPDHALTLLDRGGRVFFCSEACRDRYGSANASSRGDRTAGRTA